ncbi:MAG: hypothetical protein ABI886_14440, partial [Betaproteobacteria bacterium]
MKTISRTVQMLAAVGLAAMLQLSQAVASPIVSIVPANQTISVGGTASIDIIVSGLTDPVGGFSLTLGFNNTFLSGASFLNDPGGKMGALTLDLSCGFGGFIPSCIPSLTGSSPLDLFFLADELETQATLADSQGLSFTLATVSFQGLADGLSKLELSRVFLSNSDGTATLEGVQTRDGSICVGGNCNVVPEPATLLL